MLLSARRTFDNAEQRDTQALIKSCEGDASKWLSRVYAVFWADRVTIRKRMGCSPYFAITGSHPILPFDLVEATYLSPPPTALLSTGDLIARRAHALTARAAFVRDLRDSIYEERLEHARIFEEHHLNQIHGYDFHRGTLVLMRNTAIKKYLDRKTRPRFLGPLLVVACNRGGAYILAELDGAVFDRPVAAYRVIPYFPRRVTPLPFRDEDLDIPAERVSELIEHDDNGDDEEPSLALELTDDAP